MGPVVEKLLIVCLNINCTLIIVMSNNPASFRFEGLVHCFCSFPQEQPEAVTPTTELEMDNMDTFLERLPPSGKMTKTESLIISSTR